MKIILVFLLIALIFIEGCQRAYTPPANPAPSQSSTIATTTSSTTTIFDCRQCQQGYICRNNECVKVEYSNTGGGGSGGGGY